MCCHGLRWRICGRWQGVSEIEGICKFWPKGIIWGMRNGQTRYGVFHVKLERVFIADNRRCCTFHFAE
jgi:hypothetical protein